MRTTDKIARVIACWCLVLAALCLLCTRQSRAQVGSGFTWFRRTLPGQSNNHSREAAADGGWSDSLISYPGYARIADESSPACLSAMTQKERIEYLEHNSSLTDVTLSRPTRADLKALATMPNLKQLELNLVYIDADSLRELAQAKGLDELVIRSGFDDAHPLPKSFGLSNVKSISLNLIPEWMGPASAGDQDKLLALNHAKNRGKLGALDQDLYFPHPEQVPSFDASTIPTDTNIKELLLVCSTVQHGAQIARACRLERLQIDAIDVPDSAYSAIRSLKHLADLGLYIDRYNCDAFKGILQNASLKVVSVFKPDAELKKILCAWARPLSLFVHYEDFASAAMFRKDESASIEDIATNSHNLKDILGAATRLRLIVCPSDFDSVIEKHCDPAAGWSEFADAEGNNTVSPEKQKKENQYMTRIRKEISENKTINTKGEFVATPPKSSKVESFDPFALRFSEGLREVQEYNQELIHAADNERWQISYKDEADKTVIPPFSARCAGDFHDGLAFMQSHDGRWHYIDKTGKTAILLPPTVSWVGDFHAGLAPVAVGGWDNLHNSQNYYDGAKWGFIDKLGHAVVQPCYEISPPGWGIETLIFHDGLARVCVALGPGQYAFGYINEKGKIAIEPKFKSAEDFSNGVATVRVGILEFTPKAWREEPTDRQTLFQLLLEKYELIGMNTEEVRNLLGKPDLMGSVPASAGENDLKKLALLHRDSPTWSYLIAARTSASYEREPDSFTWLELEHRNGKVWRYRLRSTGALTAPSFDYEPTNWVTNKGTPYERIISPDAQYVRPILE